MNWWEQPFVSFDLETTGVDVEADRIVTATIIRINPATGEKRVAEWLIKPGVDIPAEATELHGITTEHAKAHGMEPDRALFQIMEILEDAWYSMHPAVVYHAPFDLSLLDRELRRYELPLPDIGPVVDPLVLDKQFDRYRPKRVASRKLIDTARHYGITLSEEDAHGSTADALAAARVAWKLPQVFPALAAMRLPELHAAQIGWHAEQSERFENHLRKVKRKDGATAEEIAAVRINREWPLRSYGGGS